VISTIAEQNRQVYSWCRILLRSSTHLLEISVEQS